MKKNTTLLIFFLSLKSIAQIDTLYIDLLESKFDYSKAKNGYYIFKKADTLLREGILERGILKGTWKYYYSNGVLKSVEDHFPSHYNHSSYCGIYEEFYINGNLKLCGNYEYHDSVYCINCFDINDQKQITKAFGNEIKVGIWNEYHENGILKSTGRYLRGIHETHGTDFEKIPQYGSNTYMGPGGVTQEYIKDNEWKYFNNKDELTKTEFYVNGWLVNVDTYK